GARRTAARVPAGPRRFVERACTDAQVAALGPAGACTRVATVADLSACLRATHEADAEGLLALASPRGMLDPSARVCAATVSLEARRAAVVRLRHVQRCKAGPEP